MKPEEVLREKNLAVAIWHSTNHKFLSFTITKGFQDSQGNWSNARLDVSEFELLRLIRILDKIKPKMKGDVDNDNKKD